MSASEFEEVSAYLRVLTQPKEERAKGAWREEKPNDKLTLVFDTETTSDYRQDLRFGVARVYALGHLTRSVVFYERVTEEERETISIWAKDRGFDALTREAFVLGVFLPLALDQRAVVVGLNLPFDLSRLSVDFAPKRNVRATEGWTLRLLPMTNPKFAFVPGIHVEHLDSRKAFIGFTGTKGKRRSWRGAFVDLRTLTAALTGSGHSLGTAGEAFGCALAKTDADYRGKVTEEYLGYCLNDVDLTAELYSKCLDRYREFGLPGHPSRVFSSASLGKAAFRARGVSPPSLSPEIAGRLMAAYYGGKVECRVVGREVADVAVLDFTSQYPSLYCLLGAERFLTAERIEACETTEAVRTWAESLAAHDLLRRETWADSRVWSLCEVAAEGDLLPLRSTFGTAGDSPTIGWSRVTTEPRLTLPYLLPDLLAAKLYTGKLPKIVRAVTFAPVGRQRLNEISVLGARVGPDDNLIQRLTEARIAEKKEKRPGWESRALGEKVLVNSASYGVFVEVVVKKNSGEMEVHGLDAEEPFEEDGANVEEPGAVFCPLLGVMITAGAHLLLALLDSVAAKVGGEVAYMDTDSAFISPSKLAPEIARTFDALNPYSVAVPFLKDETDEKAPRADYPRGSPDTSPRFFGLSSKRYSLFVRDRYGRPRVLSGSDHGLGAYQVPGKREAFTHRVWERVIEAAIDGEDDLAGEFAHLPATAQFALTTPALLPRVAKIEGMRPFNFLTIAYRDPAAIPDGAETFELLPFVGPKDPGWIELGDKEGAKTWAHILWGFRRHRDRKYLVGPDGRIIRRSVLVKKSSLVGLGKEGAKLAARIKLGKIAGGTPSVFVDWKRRLLEMGRAEARRLGLPWRRVTEWKRSLRAGRLPLSGAAVRRLKRALLAGG